MTLEQTMPKQQILHTCRKCGWQWFSHRGKVSSSCPHCRTRLWDRERQVRCDKEQRLWRTPLIIATRKNNPCATLQQIGDKFSVSRERVRQVLSGEALPTRHYIQHQLYECGNCGKELDKWNKGGYCQKCMTIVHSVPLVCKQCGKLFYRRQVEVIRSARSPKYQGNDFCSRRCYGTWFGLHHGFTVHPENARYPKGLK